MLVVLEELSHEMQNRIKIYKSKTKSRAATEDEKRCAKARLQECEYILAKIKRAIRTERKRLLPRQVRPENDPTCMGEFSDITGIAVSDS